MKYIYPAVFSLDMTDEDFPNGVYLISFPDLPNCYTSGETLEEAYEMAEDVLNMALCGMERDKEAIPEPSSIKAVQDNNIGNVVTIIKADTTEYRKKYDNKSVRKNLSIPRWLDTLALENNVNFSSVLQRALMQELNVNP